MDTNLLLTLLILATGCMAAQKRQRERLYRGSRRPNNHIYRASGKGRGGKVRGDMLQNLLPYEAVENVPVKERMDVSLWQTRGQAKPNRRRPKRWIKGQFHLQMQTGPTETDHYRSKTHESYLTEARLGRHGLPWPLPRHFRSDSNMVYQLDTNFRFVIGPLSRSCVTLTRALRRYYVIITGRLPRRQSVVVRDEEEFESPVAHGNPATLRHVDVSVLYSCSDAHPEPTANETYALQINNNTASIIAGEVWGALRGLETLSQLVYVSEHRQVHTTAHSEQPCVHMADIVDFPRFHHRGVMINTGIHFLHPTTIKKNLEAMEHNKLNVLHWRLVDDQSFPWVSKAYPDLSNRSSKRETYNAADIAGIVEFARQRGIRVVPELDSPGHTASWRNGVPDVMINCADNNSQQVLDVSINITYTVLRGLWDDMLTTFPGRYVHLGGDEVPTLCWAKSKDVAIFMEREKIKDYGELQNYFTRRLSSIVNQLDSNRKLVFWQDVLDSGISIDERAVIQIWKPNPKAATTLAVSRGHRVIYSSPWCLNYVTSGMDWAMLYLADPLEHTVGATEEEVVMGGEACVSGEHAVDSSLLQTVWSRASAMAERMWSDRNVRNVPEAQVRLEEQRCRMIRRRIPISPLNEPSSCNLHVP
ncbi:beta-hexosaminidase subunit beta-like isoform X2 [Haliotis rufescens]|uniref:beta-hexosaminidase subunit beta-like isoform X2 n=1 Tax=Haliotis rufescens TaxID=6454 RepID=UPI00201EA09E|nr:beta-hexosaminidase subunit beta-like isoform X2 [Haliotis rufescens]